MSQAVSPPQAPVPLPRLEKVLCTTDLTELGNRAVPYAYALVAEGGLVCLLHVLDVHPTPSPLVPHYSREGHESAAERQRREQEATEKLLALVPAEAAARGIRTDVRVVGALDPARVIREEADQLEADAICLASRSRPGLSSTILGSVSLDVLRDTSHPVLLIRPPAGS
jgi:nucleotide-binding universal stress UspA family protein